MSDKGLFGGELKVRSCVKAEWYGYGYASGDGLEYQK